MGDTFALTATLERAPSTALIVGAGYIGLEVAEALRTRGLDVTLVEQLPQVLPAVDADLAALIADKLAAHDMRVCTGVTVTAIERSGRNGPAVGGHATDDRATAFTAMADAVVADANRLVPGCAVAIEEDYAVPGLAPEDDGAAEALCRRLTGTNRTTTVSYSSEAGQFQAAGLSTVLLGPGSIEQAHIADEFIEISQLEACEAFIGRLIAAQAA